MKISDIVHFMTAASEIVADKYDALNSRPEMPVFHKQIAVTASVRANKTPPQKEKPFVDAEMDVTFTLLDAVLLVFTIAAAAYAIYKTFSAIGSLIDRRRFRKMVREAVDSDEE